MKFNKTVAQALAHKVRANLLEERSKFIKEYKPSKEIQKEIEKQVTIFVEARTVVDMAVKALKKYACISPTCTSSAEDLISHFIKEIARKNVPELPSTNDLVDDFLVESLEVESAQELIDKVTAKYIA